MKRVLSLVVSLLLLALPALAESASPFDYVEQVQDDGSLLLSFEDISLRLPADWQGKFTALQTGGGIAFYQTASYEKYAEEGLEGGGFLFSLGASVNGSFSELPAFKYLGFSERSAMNYYLVLPTDYPPYMQDDIRAEYDAMYAQLDYIAQNAVVYADEDEADAAGAEGEKAWTPAEVRYAFEHSMLPRYFYDNPENMLGVLAGNGLYPLWNVVATDNGVDPTYPEADCAEHWFTAADGAKMLLVELPEPDANTLCYRIYFIYNPATGEAAYYTVESDDFAPNLSFVCTWTKEREHVNHGARDLLDRTDAGYADALLAEARDIAGLAGISQELTPADAPDDETGAPDDDNLAVVECPELGFSTLADPAYSREYQEGTGLYIYTGPDGSIPYVIVYRSDDLLLEPAEYIREQYTPHMQKQYGDDLVSWVEYESYDVGGKQLPAGLYTYRLQGHLIDMLRVFDSTGAHTVSYTAKYVNGEGEATLAALDAAVRGYREE